MSPDTIKATLTSRRGFLGAAAAGTLGGGFAAYKLIAVPPATGSVPNPLAISGKSACCVDECAPVSDLLKLRRTMLANLAKTMPGPFPGRLIEIAHPGSVAKGEVKAEPVREMVRRGMKELGGTDDAVETWRMFFQKGDRVGIKVNPVGAPHSISNHATVHAIVEGLERAGVRRSDILIFDRYRQQFLKAGYKENLPEGCHWECTVEDYDNVQLDIAGYDPDVYADMPLISPRYHDPTDDRYRLSHLSLIVSKKVDKIVNLAVLKDHGSGGVTLALKNMSHGFVNNVARSHGGPAFNHCNTFIPAIVSLPQIRRKVVLHVLDGLKGVFQGGPGAAPQFVWEYKSLFFATDPVAMDKVGWEIVDAERARHGLCPVAKAGRMGIDKPHREGFDIRQPQHIDLAGALGLGVWDREEIKHRRIELE